MRYRGLLSFLLFFLLSFSLAEAKETRIEKFSPVGTVKSVRQVTVRFSDQIVPFGEPRQIDPFDIKCPEKGSGRWIDGKNWSYDFERDLPAGIICVFKLKDIKDVRGEPLDGQRTYSFSTGGPAITESYPYEGSEDLAEDQIFILQLDAEPKEESVNDNVYFSIEGINERVGARIVKGKEREDILKTSWYRDDKRPKILLQSKQSFPTNAIVRLIWGKGVMSQSGVVTTEDQALSFRSRSPFTATFSCERENADADCIPLLPMYVYFSTPISWDTAKNIVLKGADGKAYTPLKPGENTNQVYNVTFKGPFPENASFTLALPKDVKDDSGRSLTNADIFPLTINTEAYPPLAKFSGRFGIIELNEDATLPVTLRNIEPEVKASITGFEKTKRTFTEKLKEQALEQVIEIGESINSILPGSLKAKGIEIVEGLKGRLYKIQAYKDKEIRDQEIIAWLKRAASVDRKNSIFKSDNTSVRTDIGSSKNFSIPKSGGQKSFEVIGIPLKEAGLYIVEIESDALGASLLAEQKPMYVPAVALVTNLSAHFKWGRESSLVWVTTLDKAKPVNNADITIRDCEGKLIWEGETGNDGIARINTQLPTQDKLPYCSFDINYSEASDALREIGSGLFVFAKTFDDMTFLHSSWEKGIEPWRFNLPDSYYESERKGAIAHTVFDRTLLRAGETVHMKHILRRHTTGGFDFIGDNDRPDTVIIEHQGTQERFKFPLTWSANGAAESKWDIPKDAKLGMYDIILVNKDTEDNYSKQLRSGSFRVQEFRVPLMRGIIQPPSEPLIKAKEATVDVSVSYLSGGGASKEPVKLRAEVRTRFLPQFEEFEGFVLSNGKVKEGIQRRGDDHSYEGVSSNPDNVKLETLSLTLDEAGAARAKLSNLPAIEKPSEIITELEFKDPNGETQTVSRNIPLWTSNVIVGIKPDSWTLSKDSLKYKVAVMDLSGKPQPNAQVTVSMFQEKTYSHRKRLIGGFYSYENVNEIKKVGGTVCQGETDRKGVLICESKTTLSGSVILQAEAADSSRNATSAYTQVWIAGGEEWWFQAEKDDRIDFLPEQKRYEPDDTAKFQVRMPFREATALITVEREGIIDTYVKKISGKTPVVEIPVKGNYAPNVFVSALVVRGRTSDIKPTAIVDLGKPAFKLGISEINVGWKAHELTVKISSDKDVYKIREKAKVDIEVQTAYGKTPPKGTEVVVAAIDEGLLELLPNTSWKLLEGMMEKRGYEVRTSTAQMQVVGKRHYGLKALPQGGGGGRQITRELFDTLLFWQATVALDDGGRASIEIPLNDSLTSFKVVAIATGGKDFFGTGEKSIRTTQDLMLLSGIPPVIREGDKFKAGFTARNTSDRKMEIEVSGSTNINNETKELPLLKESLAAGEAKEIGWDVTAPYSAGVLTFEINAKERNGKAADTLKVKETVVPAVPTRVFQATLTQVENSVAIDVAKPQEAIAGKGGINVSLRPKLSNGLDGVIRYMRDYPYTCMEQKVSRAVALRDEKTWNNIAAEMPSYLDSDGLLKYFPTMPMGSDSLTAYVLSISNEAKYEIPAEVKERMERGLRDFIEGRVIRYSSLPTADLSIRKMAALEALSRSGAGDAKLLSSITVEPNLWPTSGVIDWINVLERMKDIPARDSKLSQAEQIIRSRLNMQGTRMGFSTERDDNLWWLMVSTDLNSVKTLLTLSSFDSWREDVPRIANGIVGRLEEGHWDTTIANAWGVLAMERFSEKFESTPVTGTTTSALNEIERTVDWNQSADGKSEMFGWADGVAKLTLTQNGTGKPWATIQSLAAIPLKEPFSSGYTIKKTYTPIEQKTKGKWTRGDIVRVRLELEAQADMTWVVVDDPIPAGSAILGTGLGRDSELLTTGEKREGWVWPSFEERTFQAFRAYYDYVPKGKWVVEYTVRLNNYGTFNMPPTRVEALYSPEMFGEIPNAEIRVD